MISGKYALLAVVTLCIAGAGGGWWYQQNLQRRPLALWGRDSAQLILRAGDVELCRLERVDGARSRDAIEVRGKSYHPIECLNAARIPGFLHLRHSLLNDYSFDWDDVATGEHDWRYALRFRDGDKTASLLISDDFSYALLVETGAQACITPIAGGIKKVFREALDQI